MLLTLKTFQQQTFTVEIELHQTVLNLKEKIESLKGQNEYPVWKQKLIYSGQILCDNSLLSEYSFDKTKFIVVMNTAVPVAPTQTLNEPEIQQPSTSQGPNVSAAFAIPIADSPTSLSHTAEESDSYNLVTAIAEAEFLEATEFQEKIEKIVGMGYQKVDVEVSLIANSGNLERAVEYLIDEIPLNFLNDSFSLDEDEDLGATGIGANQRVEEKEDPFAFLKTQPAFNQMTAFLRENPSFFNAVLQRIRETNPALLQIISQYQEEFVTLVNEESLLDSSSSSIAFVQDDADEQISEVAKMSPKDQNAIDRLKCLHVPNFPEKFVKKVYVAFNKNEKLAANFLLSPDE